MPRGVKKVDIFEEAAEIAKAATDSVDAMALAVLTEPEEVVAEAPTRPTAPITGKWVKVAHEGKFYMASPQGQIVTGGLETENQIDDMVMKLNNKRR